MFGKDAKRLYFIHKDDGEDASLVCQKGSVVIIGCACWCNIFSYGQGGLWGGTGELKGHSAIEASSFPMV